MAKFESADHQKSISVSVDGDELLISGLFMYGDEPAGTDSAAAFWAAFRRGAPEFDQCTGSYRVHVRCANGKELFFADNSGMQRYYINERTAAVGHTLPEALAEERACPNEEAIAQFLQYGCIYGMETVAAGITLSDPEQYYVVENGRVTAMSKQLTPMEEMNAGADALERQMDRFARAAANQYEGLACTITGGTDSRSILAHLLHNGIRPLLDITGHDGQADVAIAQEIARRLNAKLLCVSDTPEEGWIEEAIQAAGGTEGVCGVYRLYKKARILQKDGVALELGGVAGELYKNSFINQDYPFYGGAPKWDRYLNYKVATHDFPMALCGERILTPMKELPGKTLAWLSGHTGKNKANAYLSAGYEILQARLSGVSQMNAQWYTLYSPLIERSVAALAFQKDPHKLEMQAWQREQVSTFAPEIKDVETDRGLTCDSGKMKQEHVKSMLFLLRVATQRVFGRGKIQGRIDPCFEEGLSSPQYAAALERCKTLGIIAGDVRKEQIPQAIADRIFALGTIL